jgi:hypothetical protein
VKLRLRRREEVRDRAHGSIRIDVRSGAAPLAEPPPARARNDFELALLRLELLTGVPPLERESSPEWPEAFLAAATAGLDLAAHELATVMATAQQWRRGYHGPFQAAARLRPKLDPELWGQTLRDFEALNHGVRAAVEVVLASLGADGVAIPALPMVPTGDTPMAARPAAPVRALAAPASIPPVARGNDAPRAGAGARRTRRRTRPFRSRMPAPRDRSQATHLRRARPHPTSARSGRSTTSSTDGRPRWMVRSKTGWFVLWATTPSTRVTRFARASSSCRGA